VKLLGVEMRDEAERYCSLIERADSFERDAFVAGVAESLGGLLAAAAKLPDVSPTEADLPAGPAQEAVGLGFAAVLGALVVWLGYWTSLATNGADAQEMTARRHAAGRGSPVPPRHVYGRRAQPR
jgi:hypothetical protein